MRSKLLKAMASCLLVVSFVICCFVTNISASEVANEIANAESNNVYENKTFLTDVSEDFSFEIVSKHDINDSNYSQFIIITDVDNNIKYDLNIEKKMIALSSRRKKNIFLKKLISLL